MTSCLPGTIGEHMSLYLKAAICWLFSMFSYLRNNVNKTLAPLQTTVVVFLHRLFFGDCVPSTPRHER
jgi:hypothetical protein